MPNRTLPFLLLLACSWGSCQSDAPQSGASPETGTTETAPATPPTTTATPGAAAASPAAATPATTATGANPPHGQPGHRCDIAVGAPLNSPPNAGKNAAAPVTTTPSAPAATAPATAPAGKTTAVAPGANPPHGQPGHRCDIAVGAPLDSKPKQ